MSPWLQVLAPAIVTVLLVRLDSKIIGPYFALSELIPGTGGMLADVFYSNHTLRFGVVRRLLYPLILGAFLNVAFSLPLREIGSSGFIAAGLHLWPVLFHGLPERVSKRDWELPVLYSSYLLVYVLLAISGALAWDLVQFASENDLKRWITDQFLGTFGFWIFATFVAGINSVVKRRLREKVKGRADAEE